jgi:hypothetical protein
VAAALVAAAAAADDDADDDDDVIETALEVLKAARGVLLGSGAGL